MLTWWMLWRVPALLGIVMAAWWFGVRPVLEERGWVAIDATFALCGDDRGGGDMGGRTGCVVDGDTVVLFGAGDALRRIRLTGFDAPELDGACQAERKAALRAKLALHEWLAEGAFEWNGGAEPPRDRFGRELRRARRVTPDGTTQNLAEAMVARGLAARDGWGEAPTDWCA